MTTAFTMAMFAVAVSLGAVFISMRSSKANADKRQGVSDSGTIMMASDGGADCSPGDGGGSDAGCDSGGGDGGGDGGGGD